jgi:hypothetical protein
MTPKHPKPIAELSADAYLKCIHRIDVGMADTGSMNTEQLMHQTIRYAVASAKCQEARQALERALRDARVN